MFGGKISNKYKTFPNYWKGLVPGCDHNWIEKTKAVMDTVYISHGSPTLCIDESIPARHFLKAWQDKALCPRPKSILIISGHWDTALPSVNVITGPNDTIHDFYGFPKNMYKVYLISLIHIHIHLWFHYSHLFSNPLWFVKAFHFMGFFSFPKRKQKIKIKIKIHPV